MIYSNKIIGSRIRQARKESGLTQEALAEKLGVTRRPISEWEKGNTLPELSLLVKMCEEFDCEIGYLLGEHEEKTRFATDICDAIGLSEDSVNILARTQGYLKDLIKRYRKEGITEECPEEDTKITNSLSEYLLYCGNSFGPYDYIDFIDFFIKNCDELFSRVEAVEKQKNALSTLMSDKLFPEIKKMYKTSQSYDDDYQISKIDPFFTDDYARETFYKSLRERVSETITPQEVEKYAEIYDFLSALNPELKPLAEHEKAVERLMLQRYSSAYEILKNSENPKRLEWEVQDTFMDLIKAYIKNRNVCEV